MAEILSINGGTVGIGTDNGDVISVPIACIQYPNVRVGDRVNVYSDGTTCAVTRAGGVSGASPYYANEKYVNKHVFVWVCCFLFGELGIDRFVRGQVAAGICKLLFWWLTLGIWPLVDWIIALVKAYGQAFGQDDDLVFINGKYGR